MSTAADIPAITLLTNFRHTDKLPLLLEVMAIPYQKESEIWNRELEDSSRVSCKIIVRSGFPGREHLLRLKNVFDKHQLTAHMDSSGLNMTVEGEGNAINREESAFEIRLKDILKDAIHDNKESIIARLRENIAKHSSNEIMNLGAITQYAYSTEAEEIRRRVLETLPPKIEAKPTEWRASTASLPTQRNVG
jgi:hypothetical protein